MRTGSSDPVRCSLTSAVRLDPPAPSGACDVRPLLADRSPAATESIPICPRGRRWSKRSMHLPGTESPGPPPKKLRSRVPRARSRSASRTRVQREAAPEEAEPDGGYHSANSDRRRHQRSALNIGAPCGDRHENTDADHDEHSRQSPTDTRRTGPRRMKIARKALRHVLATNPALSASSPGSAQGLSRDRRVHCQMPSVTRRGSRCPSWRATMHS